MTHKPVLYMIVGLMLVSPTLANLNLSDGLIAVFEFENITNVTGAGEAPDSVNSFDMTAVKAWYVNTTAGINNNFYWTDRHGAATAYWHWINISPSLIYSLWGGSGNNPYTFNYWVWADCKDVTAQYGDTPCNNMNMLWTETNAGSEDLTYYDLVPSGNNYSIRTYSKNVSNYGPYTSAYDLKGKVWSMVTHIWTGTNSLTYFNATLVQNLSVPQLNYVREPANPEYTFTGLNTMGGIDELYVYNKSVNQSMINDLFMSGTGNFYSNFSASGGAPAGGSALNYTTALVNLSSNSSFWLGDNTSFNDGVIPGTGQDVAFVGLEGVRVDYNLTDVYNITNITIYNMWDGTSSTKPYTLKILFDGQVAFSSFTHDGIGSDKDTVFLNTSNLTLSGANIVTFNFYDFAGGDVWMDEIIINGEYWTGLSAQSFSVKAKDNNTDSYLTNFWAYVNGTNYTTTNGTIYTSIDRGDNATGLINMSVGATNYTTVTELNYNFSTSYLALLSVRNTIEFWFYDEITKDPIITPDNNDTIFLRLISDTFANNYTKSISWANITLSALVPENYTIVYGGQNYTQRTIYLELEDNSYNNITLYVLRKNEPSNITATVYDENNAPAENVYISVLKYYIDTNSYEVVETIVTDFNGQATLHLIKNTEYYKFYLYRPYGTLILTTNPSVIIQDSIRFQVNFGQPVLEDWYQTESITHDLDFTPNPGYFRFSYSDPSNIASQYCLSAYKKTNNGAVLLNNTCLSSNIGNIIIGITPQNGTTFEGVGYAIVNSTQYILQVETYKYPDSDLWGNMGLFIIILLTIGFASIGFASLPAMFVLTPLPLAIGSWMGIVTLPVYASVLLVAAGIIAAVVVGRAD